MKTVSIKWLHYYNLFAPSSIFVSIVKSLNADRDSKDNSKPFMSVYYQLLAADFFLNNERGILRPTETGLRVISLLYLK